MASMILDRITDSLMNDFIDDHGIVESDLSKCFELFCNYSVISNEYTRSFDFANSAIGGGGDCGIDGLAIIVNGQIVEGVEDVDELLNKNGYLEVLYIFIQAKTSSSIEVGKIHNFLFGVSNFFKSNPSSVVNEDLQGFSKISNYILSKAPKFRANPICKAYYIFTGSPKPDKNVDDVISKYQQELEGSFIFDKVDIKILGASDIAKLYKKSRSPVTSTFTFLNKIPLPDIEGVDEAFFGIVPVSEFRKLIVDDNDNILNVFDDNVRDFQGISNTVNVGINDTLCGDNPKLFSVLNNGVTIVANSLKASGQNITLTDYQIVNGCQTSNVLYENRFKHELDDVCIPLRLIVTTNDDIKAQITVCTNNQTAIKKEQLAAMSEFQKNLQSYYEAIGGVDRLYYERRTKEYSSNKAGVQSKQIISIATQLKSFSSMFNQDPHMVTTYFGKLAAKIGQKGSKLFESDHHYSTYYMSGLAYHKLDKLFSDRSIDKRYKKIKFYLLMLFPLIASESPFPPLNSNKKCENYCAPLIKYLNSDIDCRNIFELAVQIVNKAGVRVDDKEALKSKEMTIDILSEWKKSKVIYKSKAGTLDMALF